MQRFYWTVSTFSFWPVTFFSWLETRSNGCSQRTRFHSRDFVSVSEIVQLLQITHLKSHCHMYIHKATPRNFFFKECSSDPLSNLTYWLGQFGHVRLGLSKRLARLGQNSKILGPKSEDETRFLNRVARWFIFKPKITIWVYVLRRA
jgi:hypothetical protein